MIPPRYTWAYGRLTREIRNELKDYFGESITIKVYDSKYKYDLRYIIRISNKDQSLGEIEISNSKSVKVTLDKTLEDITNTLESKYSPDKIETKLDCYLEEYSKLIYNESKIFEKLPHGPQLSDYPELEKFQEALWPIRGQTGQSIWMTYFYFDNKYNHKWIIDMTGLKKDQIRNIRDKIRGAIGPKLVEEITKLEALRLDPFID